MSNKQDDTLEIYLNGKIDKDNADEVEESILAALKENEHKKLLVDMSDVSEVTEDGLKMLKKVGEECKDVELTNVTDGIYEVFEKNGLTSIMPVYQLKLEF